MIEELEATRDDVKTPPFKILGKNNYSFKVSLNLVKTFNCYKISFLSYAFEIASAGSLWKKK